MMIKFSVMADEPCSSKLDKSDPNRRNFTTDEVITGIFDSDTDLSSLNEDTDVQSSLVDEDSSSDDEDGTSNHNIEPCFRESHLDRDVST